MRLTRQPPINRKLRSREEHGFWPAAVVAATGLVLLLGGFTQPSRVPLKDGGAASEVEVVRAFTFSGLEYRSYLPPSLPPSNDDPAELMRWERQQAEADAQNWTVRVNPRAATRCPT